METVTHPRNKNRHFPGKQLQPGTTVKPGDMYAAWDGTWKKVPYAFVGHVVQSGNKTVWVRPIS